jgi:ABC-2 type transport system permease protein
MLKALYKKEISYYLNNPVGYIILILFGVFANFWFVKDIFVVGTASMRAFFDFTPWLLLLFIPALTMRIFAEEKRNNTIEVLLTLPVSERQIVWAKFHALLTLVGIGLLLTISLPLTLAFLAKVYLPEVIVGYLGLLLLSAFLISLSMIFSLLSKNQVVAFLSSLLAGFFLFVLGSEFLSNFLPKIVLDLFIYYTPLYHLFSFNRAVLDLRSIVYFVSSTIAFLLICKFLLENRD